MVAQLLKRLHMSTRANFKTPSGFQVAQVAQRAVPLGREGSCVVVASPRASARSLPCPLVQLVLAASASVFSPFRPPGAFRRSGVPDLGIAVRRPPMSPLGIRRPAGAPHPRRRRAAAIRPCSLCLRLHGAVQRQVSRLCARFFVMGSAFGCGSPCVRMADVVEAGPSPLSTFFLHSSDMAAPRALRENMGPLRVRRSRHR